MSEYDDVWEDIRQKINVTAKDYVPKLYESLTKEGYSPREARDKIKKDAFNIWKVDTIDKYIPQEAKQIIRVSAGQQRGKTKTDIEKSTSEVAYKDSPGLESSKNDIMPETEQEALAPYTATDEFLRRQKEAEATEQLLIEERRKTKELNDRLELNEREHESKLATLQDKINDFDSLTDKLSHQLQEKDRQLTNMTIRIDGEIEEPKPEKNYSVEADIKYQGRQLPVVIRVYVSGKKIGWIDREVYKARYGREPQEE